MQMHENIICLQWIGTGRQFCDINKALSIVNRKLHRQMGLLNVYAAQYNTVGVNAAPANATQGIQISGAARSWTVRNSLVKIFSLWKSQNARAYKASSPSIKGTWRDFKVYLNEPHKDAVAAGTDLLPHSGGPINADPYLPPEEWKYSNIITVEAIDAGAASEIDHDSLPLIIYGANNHATGGHWGIVDSYQMSRAMPQLEDPNLPAGITATSVYSQAQGDLSMADEELLVEAAIDGDAPPYDLDAYPGSLNNEPEPIAYCAAMFNNQTDFGRTINLGGFSCPNGLIQIDTTGGAGDQVHTLMLYVGKQEAY